MKQVKLLSIILILGIGITMISCEKYTPDQYQKCFNVPETKKVSTIELVNAPVEVVWSTSYGMGNVFTSHISKVNVLTNEFHTDSVFEAVVSLDVQRNNRGDSSVFDVIVISILFRSNYEGGYEVFAFKPALLELDKDMEFWNTNSLAEIGAAETDNFITISSNGMLSPYNADEFMCAQVTMRKLKRQAVLL
ncbi:MAG TPA: hypothetical protein PKZ36_01415 [Candidatus Paceibacterota bacterium]|nr:hypothetical protein [Candidatus Paceibacterota bacterium]HPT18045.1 hypothetical protein [Candidatus Paceibacterota bacterium]